jgi:excisionase family DNA binding protein
MADRGADGVTEPLIDAEAAGALLGVPKSWVLEEARHDRIPHIRLGKYVRFEAEAVLAWAHHRSRGPAYHLRQSNGGPGAALTARGPTPDLTSVLHR